MKDPHSPKSQLELDLSEGLESEDNPKFLPQGEVLLGSIWITAIDPKKLGRFPVTSVIQVIDKDTYSFCDDVVVKRIYAVDLQDRPYRIDRFKLQYRYSPLLEKDYPDWLKKKL